MENEQSVSALVSTTGPHFRIWAFGMLRVEVRNALGTYDMVPQTRLGGQPGRLMLKALLCRPGRKFHRSDLLSLLCDQEASQTDIYDSQRWKELAVSRLKDALKHLRPLLNGSGMLQPCLIIEEECECYQLANQDLVWTDADACMQLMDQMHMDLQQGENPLALLKDASAYFAGGKFLKEEEGE